MTPFHQWLLKRPTPLTPAISWLLLFAALALFAPGRAEAQFTAKPAVLVNWDSGLCAKVSGGSLNAGAAAVQWLCDDTLGSRWRFVPSAGTASPYVSLIADHSGKCLSVSGGSMTAGAAVVQNDCTGADSQLWLVQRFGKQYQLIAKHSGQCLALTKDSTGTGLALVQQICSDSSLMIWSFSEGYLDPSVQVRFVNNFSNLCANIYQASQAENGFAVQWTCVPAAYKNQEWSLKRALDGYQLIVQHSNKCLAPVHGSLAAIVQIVQVTCSIVNSQIWYLKASGSGGAFTIVNKNSNLCLDVYGDPSSPNSLLMQNTCQGTAIQEWRLTNASDVGSWSARVSLPIVPVGAAALYNKKVMFFAADFAFSYASGSVTYTALFDPATDTAVQTVVSNTQDDFFCPGTALLADGRFLVNGGTSAKKTSIYDPATDSWSAAAQMNIARGYNADVVLDNGQVFTIGGSWNGGTIEKGGEIWSPPNGAWTALPGLPAAPMIGPDPQGDYRGDNHAWLFGTGGGKVFHAGPSAQMNWFNTNGSGSYTSAGNRSTDGYSMNGNAVMYDINRILKLGGAPAYQDANAVTSAYTININSGVVAAPTGSLTYARSFASSVVLPNGRVFVSGGQSYALPFTDGQAILAGELWNPSTGTFSVMAAAATPRTYHSIALLLPDGRVVTGGGGLCGACTTNHADLEYYSPGYLFTDSGLPADRPVIVSAPAAAGYNVPITVTTDRTVSGFVLIRLGANTHAVNNDQRRIPLTVSAWSGTAYTVKTPANSGIGTPGYYMLFAINSAGVPSVAAIMKLG